MTGRILKAAALTVAISLAVVSGAFAAETTAAPSLAATKTPSASGTKTVSKPASRTYDLDFTLPTAGKSGCTVCHADKNLVRVSEGRTVALYVDTATLQRSAHKDVPCTGCHVDFAYKTPHLNVQNGSDWRSVAKLACKNCHDNQFTEYATGAHSPAPKPGQTASQTAEARKAAGKPEFAPLCGDCHGGHDIPSKDDTAAVMAYRKKGLEICGTCHVKEAGDYADYYHGAAYRRGAADAPSCWDCHGTHRILPTNDRSSMVNETQLVQTCGKCHTNVDESYVSYAPLIHRKSEVLSSNPLWSVINTTREAVRGAFDTIASWFGKG